MKKFDVVGIGSPLLDFIFEIGDSFLSEIGLTRGSMNLIDEAESIQLMKALSNKEFIVSPGGSSANTVAGVSTLGGNTAFIGTIGDDENGKMYEVQTIERGVQSWLAIHDALATGHAITFITPDGERTFATHLGASQDLRVDSISEDKIASAKFLHLEGYQLDGVSTREAMMHAIVYAKNNDTQVSIDLSDSGVIKRNFETIHNLLQNDIDIVFMNEHEAMALMNDTLENALEKISELNPITIVKVGEKGSHVFGSDTTHKIPAFPIEIVNTNGAGDMYAGALLFALTQGFDLKTAGHIASFSASQVVGQIEARLNETSQKAVIDFIEQNRQ